MAPMHSMSLSHLLWLRPHSRIFRSLMQLTTLFCQHLVPHVKSSLLMTHLKFDFGTSIRHISFLWTFNAVSVHIGPAQVILIERPAYQTLSPTLLMSLQPDCKIL